MSHACRFFSSRSAALILVTLLLVGCGHTPVTRTVSDAFFKKDGVAGLSLNPTFKYLRVVTKGREALLVLGYSEPHPDGDIETWYSSQGEVLRLQSGRIVSTAGLETDWRAVRHRGLPMWSEVVLQPTLAFTRERDEMPGYRFGLKEKLVVRAILPPKDAHLADVDPRNLLWFEEINVEEGLEQPSARYGLRLEANMPRVVYGEQCLSPTLCISWQTWPASP